MVGDRVSGSLLGEGENLEGGNLSAWNDTNTYMDSDQSGVASQGENLLSAVAMVLDARAARR